MKRILVIAGSDSSGGAGLEADQKVIAAHGCYAMTATSALTAQNTQGVYGIHETPSEFVQKQVEACVDDIGVDAVKTGTIAVVAEAFKKYDFKYTVVDPVMVATSGARLLPESAIKTMCDKLLPLTYLVTPNIPEANLILKKSGQPKIEVECLDGLKQLARAVHRLGPRHVLIKGGHLPLNAQRNTADSESEKKIIANVLYGKDVDEVIELAYQNSRNTHGTGCTLASAITCQLAMGNSIAKAVRLACKYVEAGIKDSINLGRGSGPLNHFHSLQILPFAPGGFVDYLLDRDDVKKSWHDYTHHEFVEKMGDGTLPRETFKYYMIQDYLYLIHFARANALAGYKAKKLDDIASAAQIVTHIRHEVNLHLEECKDFGLTQSDIEQYEESQACTAYTRYVLDIGQSEDWLALQLSLLPCLLGYGVIARRLHGLQSTDPPEPNQYLTWINNYVAEDYTSAIEKGCALIEKHAVKQSPSRIEDLVSIFVHATKMEIGFWEMGARA
ncbi:trifunctional hydroxymethylpyrimidine kinase/phosphomethylpyrimidine kinase/thiaminase [Recurvomyces mirabilis]|nr:trifunctional hydroxymethylpyrimidine kinase/phosphomethylpyrimidine kinase/thiaminase [Recurvomyces mirabilis]